jgi:hypothetical protein
MGDILTDRNYGLAETVILFIKTILIEYLDNI